MCFVCVLLLRVHTHMHRTCTAVTRNGAELVFSAPAHLISNTCSARFAAASSPGSDAHTGFSSLSLSLELRVRLLLLVFLAYRGESKHLFCACASQPCLAFRWIQLKGARTAGNLNS